MMIVTKQPAETRVFPVAFAVPVLELVDMTGMARGLVVGATPIGLPGAAASGGGLLVDVAGGTDGERYLVTVRARDALGDVHEAEIEVVVVDATWVMPDGGTAYLSIAEFVENFGLAETVLMTDGDGSGRIDRTLLIGALRAAQGIADANLAARYAVPIAVVPATIKTAIADIARARLYPRGAPEGVAGQAKEAVRLLERIASGALPLALPLGEAPAVAAPTETPILISTRGRRAYPNGLSDLL